VVLRAPDAAVEPIFLGGALLLAAWAAIPVLAYRRAARRRAVLDLPPGPTGGGALLWLAPAAIALSTVLWIGGGGAADPGSLLEDYVADWRHRQAALARDRFTEPPGTDAIDAAWQAQEARLRNDLVQLAAQQGPDAQIDPNNALNTVRWTDAGAYEGDDTRRIVIEVVRRESARGQLFGFLPTSSQRLVTIATLGEARLRLVPATRSGNVWRIVWVDIGGVTLGS
jgi:hypothetical protein